MENKAPTDREMLREKLHRALSAKVTIVRADEFLDIALAEFDRYLAGYEPLRKKPTPYHIENLGTVWDVVQTKTDHAAIRIRAEACPSPEWAEAEARALAERLNKAADSQDRKET